MLKNDILISSASPLALLLSFTELQQPSLSAVFSRILTRSRMDNCSKPEISSIARARVTEDFGPTPVIRADGHGSSVSPIHPTTSSGHDNNPMLLSPGVLESGRQISIETSAEDSPIYVTSLSPTLSTQSSVHFKTSTALQENEFGDGTNFLASLSPRGNSPPHSWRLLNATTTSTDVGTVTDFSAGSLHLYPGTLNSPMPIHIDSATAIGDSAEREQKHKKTGRVEDDGGRTPEEVDDNNDDKGKRMEFDLTQDEQIDPIPFAFRPFHLASLVDPKNLESLEAMGGVNGLLAGLGVDPTNGLNIGEKRSGGDSGVVVTTPTGGKAEAEGAVYISTVRDRQRAYGCNALPVRRRKSLLEMMWLALKDKVLVSH